MSSIRVGSRAELGQINPTGTPLDTAFIGEYEWCWDPNSTADEDDETIGTWAFGRWRLRGVFAEATIPAWEDRSYPARSQVYHSGSAWIAPSGASAGHEPGVHEAWEKLGGGDSLPTENRDPSNVLTIDPDTGEPVWSPLAREQYVFDVTKAPFNADPTGTADALPAFQAAIAAAVPYNGEFGDYGYGRPIAQIYVPQGIYRFNGQCLIKNVKGLKIFSDSNGNSEIRYFGAGGESVFKFDGADSCVVDGLSVRRSGGNYYKAAFEFVEATTEGEYQTNNCRLIECYAEAGNVSSDYWVYIGDNAGRHSTFRCSASGYREAGIYIGEGAMLYREATSLGGIYHQDAIGVWCNGGSFSERNAGAGGGYHSIDYLIGPKLHSGPISIEIMNSESSACTMIVGDGQNPSADVGPPIMLTNGRLETVNKLTDGRVIKLHNATPLIMNGSGISTTNMPLPPRIYIDTTHPDPIIPLGVNVFANVGADPESDTQNYRHGLIPSGNGTYYLGPIEYPDTWNMPPMVGPQHSLLSFNAGSTYVGFVLPTRHVMAGLARGGATRAGRNFLYTLTFVSGQQEQTVFFSASFGGALATAEVDGDYSVATSIEVLSGSPPDDLAVKTSAHTSTGFSARLSHAAIGWSVRVSFMIMRRS